MLMNEKIHELLSLRENEFVIKDEKGVFQKPRTGIKGEIVLGKDVEKAIIRELFGNEKIGSGEYRNFMKLYDIVKKHASNAMISRIDKEFVMATAHPKRKKLKTLTA